MRSSQETNHGFGSVPNVPRTMQHTRSTSIADDIDFEIFGQEMQFVEIELDPGESAIAEAGAMMFKAPTVHMDTIFGGGSAPTNSLFGSIMGAGKRLLTGESLFMTVFTHQGQGKARVAFAAPHPGMRLARPASPLATHTQRFDRAVQTSSSAPQTDSPSPTHPRSAKNRCRRLP